MWDNFSVEPLTSGNYKCRARNYAEFGGFIGELETSASPQDRGRAISLIRQNMALAADPDVKRALKSEIGRVISDARRFQRERNAAPEGGKPSRPSWIREAGEGQAEHDLRVHSLVAAVGDPDFIPELTWFVGTNAKAIDALAGFGSSALPLVLQRHADPCFAEKDCPPGLRDGLLQTLAAMVKREKIPEAQNIGLIKAVGLSSLMRVDDWESVSGGVAIAAALCDLDRPRPASRGGRHRVWPA